MSEATQTTEKPPEPVEVAAEEAAAEGQAEPAPFDVPGELKAELAEIRQEQHKQRRMLFDIKDTLDSRLLDPVLRDLMLFLDRVGLLRQELEGYAKDPRYSKRPDLLRAFGWARRKILDSLETEALEILARAGVVRIQRNGDRFDPREQRAVKAAAVDEPDKNGKVLEILRPGYRFENGLLLRAEDVVVGRFSPDGKEVGNA